MGNVWKIGSRWSDNGSPNTRIVSVFRRSGVVFVGIDHSYGASIEKGDIIAIADGKKIISVAKALDNMQPMSKFRDFVKIRPGERFSLEACDYAVGVPAKIFDLITPEYIFRSKACVRIHNEAIRQHIVDLYNQYATDSVKFDINSNVYSFEKLINQKKLCRYVIPVYQREYSWGAEQVLALFRDIVEGFKHDDPLFIGTMQLSYKKAIVPGYEYEQDVIDGQQRFSTLLCLIKLLSIRTDWKECKLGFTDILESRVNQGREENLFCEAMGVDEQTFDSLQEKTLQENRYLANMKVLDEEIKNLISDESENQSEDKFHGIVEFINKSLKFVVIETKAGLSKTLRIFNTINTAGLDLNGNDLFKVRFYEYLKDCRDASENTFNEIGQFYCSVKEINDKWRHTNNFDLITMEGVRNVYKLYLIIKFGLNRSLFEMGVDRFFDYLFDEKLNVVHHIEIGKVDSVEMSLEDLNRVRDVIVQWNSRPFKTPERMMNDFLIGRSRYGRMCEFPYQYMLFSNSKNIDEVYLYQKLMARVSFIMGLRSFKRLNEDDRFIRDQIFCPLKEKNFDNILNSLKNQIPRDSAILQGMLSKPLVEKRLWKESVCELSEYLSIMESSNENAFANEDDIKNLRNLLHGWSCDGGYDIEHIHATADGSEKIEFDLQNGIGNLMLLERHINRSIQDGRFDEKKESYKKSAYLTPRKIAAKTSWAESDIKNRLAEETSKIVGFILDALKC